MNRAFVGRPEMTAATLDLGGEPIELADYATTGLRIVAIGPSGAGKTNAGMLIAEQLSRQGWVSIIVDPESEAASLYGEAVSDADELARALHERDRPFLVVSAKDPTEFLPYGQAILDAADQVRKPIFLMIDEGQLFSASRKRKNDVGAASDLVNEFMERGRKRGLDVLVTAHRYSGSLHRSVFGNKNLTLIGQQSDPTTWSALAPQFRGSKIDFAALAALSPGEFFCFSRRGVDKIRMPMAEALKKVAPPARIIQPSLPTTFMQWDRAMNAIPPTRLEALTGPVVGLLGAVAGLSDQQMLAGARALREEVEARQ